MEDEEVEVEGMKVVGTPGKAMEILHMLEGNSMVGNTTPYKVSVSTIKVTGAF